MRLGSTVFSFACSHVDEVTLFSQNWCIMANLFSFVRIDGIESKISQRKGRYAPVVLLHEV